LPGGESIGASLGDGLERLALVRHVTLHRLHEVRNEIGAALELHIDSRPSLLGELPLPDEVVVGDDAVADDNNDDDENDPADHESLQERARCAQPRRDIGTGNRLLQLNETR